MSAIPPDFEDEAFFASVTWDDERDRAKLAKACRTHLDDLRATELWPEPMINPNADRR